MGVTRSQSYKNSSKKDDLHRRELYKRTILSIHIVPTVVLQMAEKLVWPLLIRKISPEGVLFSFIKVLLVNENRTWI